MRRTLFITLLTLQWAFSYGQTVGIQWQKPFGGSDYENFYFVQKTPDNGCLLLMKNASVDGDFAANPNAYMLVKINRGGYREWQRPVAINANFFTYKSSIVTASGDLYILGQGFEGGNHGGNDIWIGKINSAGVLVWQNSYGGTGNDTPGSFIVDADGNLVVTGSVSNATGDITGPHRGGYDVWVFKLNPNGTLLWNRCFGGSISDYRDQALVKQIGTDYYILTETTSNDGDASGNHGSWDLWFFKINNAGILQWQVQYGGAQIEASKDFAEAAGGGFYLLGYSYSTTIPNTHSNTIDPDLYLVKVSATGTMEWHKCFGGAYGDFPVKIFPEDDGGCVLFAKVMTVNGNSGDIIGFPGSYDEIWSVKINTSQAIAWQRCIGGNGQDDIAALLEEKYDDAGNLLPDNQRSYTILARTTSSTRDMTGFHTNPNSYPDVWLAKMKKSDRTLLWSRCMGGSYSEVNGTFARISNQEYIVGCLAESADGDVAGNHGTAGTGDGWVAKVGPVNTIKGIVYVDQNANSIKDAGEKFYGNALVKSEKPNDLKISASLNGAFKNDADTGTYTTTILNLPPYYTSSLASRQSVFTQYNQKDSFAFPLVPIPGHWDLKVFLVPYSEPRPNFFGRYQLVCTNVGSEIIPSATLKLVKDSRTIFGSAVPGWSGVVADTASWALTNFSPFDTLKIDLVLSIPAPPVLSMGNIIRSILSVSYPGVDETPLNNADTLYQVLLDSYDPNDKTESHAGEIWKSAVQAGTDLKYVIRFQNTGTAPAINIRVKDTLDAGLDWSTLQVIRTSHPATFNMTGTGELTWTFSNINLPDSNANEPASHGYIAYSIRPYPTLAVGDTIKNSASIYFDFNPPVKTNVSNTVVVDSVLKTCPQGNMVIAPRVFGSNFQWQVNEGAGFVNISDNANYSGSTNDSLRIISPPTSWYGKKYRCVVTGPAGTQYSPEYVLKFQVTWNGSFGNAWSLPDNWSCGVLPDDYTDVIVPGSVENSPQVNVPASCRSIQVQPGATVVVLTGFTLSVRGN